MTYSSAESLVKMMEGDVFFKSFKWRKRKFEWKYQFCWVKTQYCDWFHPFGQHRPLSGSKWTLPRLSFLIAAMMILNLDLKFSNGGKDRKMNETIKIAIYEPMKSVNGISFHLISSSTEYMLESCIYIAIHMCISRSNLLSFLPVSWSSARRSYIPSFSRVMVSNYLL